MTSERSGTVDSNETLVNIGIASELLDSYMEVCVSYRCKECSYSSTDQKLFYEHCLEHLLKDRSRLETLIYVCSACGKAFNSREDTKKHMKEEHQPKVITETTKAEIDVEKEIPPTLNLSISTNKQKSSKKRNKYLLREKEKLPCRRRGCNVSFQKDIHVDIHFKCHLEGDLKTYCCFVCNVLFNNWPSCSEHLYKSHEIDCGLLTCNVCIKYKTWAPLKLENHMRIHSELRAFTCMSCGRTFKQPSQLRNHHRIHAQPAWSKSQQCTLCFKMYSDAKALKKHKDEVHSKLRPFVCNVCGHTSARKSLMALHQRQHTGHKPLECSMCAYVTADHNSLRAHTMRHTGVRPYNCPACTFTGIRSSNYIRHVRQMHPDEDLIFTCDRCPYKTVSDDNYTRHISDHLTGLIKGIDPVQKPRVAVPKGFEKWLNKPATNDDKVHSKQNDPDVEENDEGSELDNTAPLTTNIYEVQGTAVRRSVITSASDY